MDRDDRRLKPLVAEMAAHREGDRARGGLCARPNVYRACDSLVSFAMFALHEH